MSLLSDGFLDSSVEETAKWVESWNETCGYDGVKLAQMVRKLKVGMRVLVNCNEKMLTTLAKRAKIKIKQADIQQIAWWLKFNLEEEAEKEEEAEEAAILSGGEVKTEDKPEAKLEKPVVKKEGEAHDAEDAKEETESKKSKSKAVKSEKKPVKTEKKPLKSKRKKSASKKQPKAKPATALGKLRANHVQRNQFERVEPPKTRSMRKAAAKNANEGKKRKTVKIAIDRTKIDNRDSAMISESRELDKMRDTLFVQAQKTCKNCLDILEFLKKLPGANLITNLQMPKFDSKKKPNDLEGVRQAIQKKQFRNGRNFAAAIRQIITKHMKNHNPRNHCF